jgi:hypothetical protein
MGFSLELPRHGRLGRVPAAEVDPMLERIAVTLASILLCACRADPAPSRSAPPAAGSSAKAVAELPPEARAAYERLRSAERFVDSMVGYDGGLPQEAIDLRALVRADPRGAACARLLDEATPAGKLLALCGLWRLDPARFEAGVASLRGDPTQVTVHSGCEILREPLGDILERANAIRLVDREQTIEEWTRAEGGRSAHLDIAGGSYPRRLLGLE